jgi:DNA-directed RNA polymerase subunit RPC12/RpoP
MLTVACPSCSRSLAAGDEKVGQEIRCTCGHRFVLSMPLSETLKEVVANAAPRPRVSPENESIWTKPLFPSPPPTTAVATRGPISCPFCGFVTIEDANLLGQRILCPKCHANFRAPDCEADKKSEAAFAVIWRYVIGIVLVTVGVAGLSSRQANFWTCFIFALGVGLILTALYKSISRLLSKS